jgi:hypothetical protein
MTNATTPEQPPTIAIVMDDDNLLLIFVSMLLMQQGVRFRPVNSADAVNNPAVVFKPIMPDLIVIDLYGIDLDRADSYDIVTNLWLTIRAAKRLIPLVGIVTGKQQELLRQSPVNRMLDHVLLSTSISFDVIAERLSKLAKNAVKTPWREP